MFCVESHDAASTEGECGDSFPQEPASMPYIPSDNPGFSYKNPAYQSAHPQCGVESSSEEKATKTTDDTNMKKWKGVVFNADEEKNSEQNPVLQRDNEVRFTRVYLLSFWPR